MRRCWPALAVLLAGCTVAGGWAQPGADASAIADAYRDCRALAASAVKTAADIDQDILATRPDDLQRAGAFRVATQTMQDQTSDRAAAIVASCMRAKGFAKPR